MLSNKILHGDWSWHMNDNNASVISVTIVTVSFSLSSKHLFMVVVKFSTQFLSSEDLLKNRINYYFFREPPADQLVFYENFLTGCIWNLVIKIVLDYENCPSCLRPIWIIMGYFRSQRAVYSQSQLKKSKSLWVTL